MVKKDYDICKTCAYYYGEIDACMVGEEDVPADMERKCEEDGQIE